MSSHRVLPTLPEPEPAPQDPAHGHEMPHDVPSRYDEVPPDIGTGQAGFLLAVVVTLAIGIIAIRQLQGGSLSAHGFERAAAGHMEPPGRPGSVWTTR